MEMDKKTKKEIQEFQNNLKKITSLFWRNYPLWIRRPSWLLLEEVFNISNEVINLLDWMRYKVWFGSGNASFKDFLLKVHNLLNSLIWHWTKLTEFWRKRKTKKSLNSEHYSTSKLKGNISSTYLMTIAKPISKNASSTTQKSNWTPSSKPKAITKSQFMTPSK